MILRQLTLLCLNVRRRLRAPHHMRLAYKEWRELAATEREIGDHRNVNRLLIVPCDPWSFTGSRGDEAMILAVAHYFTDKYPGIEIAAITADPAASSAAQRMGFKPLEAWRAPMLLRNISDAIEQFDPDLAIVLGADVIDGYYSPMVSLTLMATADLLARRGTRTSLLGFSFNAKPSKALRAGLDSLCPRLSLNVRDAVSMGRFHEFSATAAKLVADTAFLLKPATSSPRYQEVSEWVDARKRSGDVVLAVNVHPMLIKDAQDRQLTKLNSTISDALEDLGDNHSISFLLLPHDYRDNIGDNQCLGPIAHRLSSRFPGRVCHVAEKHSAAELKALAGLPDGLVSSRMHLAIAALGMGRPVAAFTYQDKFQGLFRHFDLPEWLLMSSPCNSTAKELSSTLQRFIRELPVLRTHVAKTLPTVLALAERNLEI